MDIFRIFKTTYPMYGFAGDCRAMTADEILQMQLSQQAAMQNVWPPRDMFSYLMMANQYQPPERSLDERFAEFKVRLAEAIARHVHNTIPLDSKTKSPPYGA